MAIIADGHSGANSKSEYRNTKQSRMTKIQNTERLFEYGNSDFESVSDFGFSISDFSIQRGSNAFTKIP